jgi:beta-phosphoglucomutase
MDGTLVEAKDWHFHALNDALRIFGQDITREEHEAEFNGLPTRIKLAKLTEQGRIPAHLHSLILEIKQERTLRWVSKDCFPRIEQLLMFSWLKSQGILVAVATNSIRQTAEVILKSAGILERLDLLVTNEDVAKSKPDAEIYIKASSLLGVMPGDCLVIEDHEYGIKSAIGAGCKVHKVSDVEEVSTLLIQQLIRGT